MGCMSSKGAKIPPVTGTIVAAPKDGVPARVKAVFQKFDEDKDGKLTLEEITIGFDREFKTKLPAHARDAIPELFEKHAKADGAGPKQLGRQLFSRFYAEILFKVFDADNNGWLSLAEAQNALQYLLPKGTGGSDSAVNVAFPADAYTPEGELRLQKAWFYQVFKSMGDASAQSASGAEGSVRQVI